VGALLLEDRRRVHRRHILLAPSVTFMTIRRSRT